MILFPIPSLNIYMTKNLGCRILKKSRSIQQQAKRPASQSRRIQDTQKLEYIQEQDCRNPATS